MIEAIIRRRFLVSGLVQGVGFRYWTVRQAGRFDVRGYVRNLPDGRVEVIADGPVEDVKAFEALLIQGPPYGHVRDVLEIAEEPRNDFTEFTVRY